MKKRSNWTKTTGAIALGLMVLSPVASYAVDLDLQTRTQERIEARASEQRADALSNRYMETEEHRTQERNKVGKQEGEQRRSEARNRSEKREHKDGDYNHDRQNRDGASSGSYDSGRGGGRSRGRGR